MGQDQNANTNDSHSLSTNEASHCAEASQSSTSPRYSQRHRSISADSVNQILAGIAGRSGTELSRAEQSSQHAVKLSYKDGQKDDVVSELPRSMDHPKPSCPNNLEPKSKQRPHHDLIERAVKRGQPSTAQAVSQRPRLIMGDGKWQSTIVTLTVEGISGAARHYFDSDLWRYGGRASLLRDPDWHEADSIDFKVSNEHVMVEVRFRQDEIRRSTTWSWSSDEKGIFRMHPEHIHVVEMVCGYLNLAAGNELRERAVRGLFDLPHGSSRVFRRGLSTYLVGSFVGLSGFPGPFDPEWRTKYMIDTEDVVEALTRVHGIPMEMVQVDRGFRNDRCLAAAASETGLIDGTYVRLPRVWNACKGSPCLCGDSVMVLDTTQEQLKVRELALGEEYLAISYVWTQHDEGSLLSYVRRATEETGIYSVWVDRMCINQRCNQHKARQIPRMREVYQSGYATVALVPDITATLPKIFHTPAAIVFADTLSVTRPFILQMISCVWRTRCWTWQEGLLGARGYYVTQKQVLPARIVSDHLAWADFRGPHGLKYGIGHRMMDSLGVCSLRCRIRTWDQKISIGDLLDAEDQELIQYWLLPRAKTLGEALQLTRDRTSSRPEDQVYSVLGMVTRGEELRVVYGESRNAILRRAVNGGLLGAEILDSESVSNCAGESWAAKNNTRLHIGQLYDLRRHIRGPIQIDDRGLKCQFHRLEGVTRGYINGSKPVLKLTNSEKLDIRFSVAGRDELQPWTVPASQVDQVLLPDEETIGTLQRSRKALFVSGTGENVVRLATGAIYYWGRQQKCSTGMWETTLVWRIVG